MRPYCSETCCRSRCSRLPQKSPSGRQPVLSKTASLRLLHLFLTAPVVPRPTCLRERREPVAPVFFGGEMPNLCYALTAAKLGFGEGRPALTPPLREAALCHESSDSGNPTSLPSRRGLGQCGFGHWW